MEAAMFLETPRENSNLPKFLSALPRGAEYQILSLLGRRIRRQMYVVLLDQTLYPKPHQRMPNQ
jgi:hypothetical protein|tara:strand:- start:725 stop:916 length:192 start_codon:yes stop_codon:yes gene_type:complete